MKKYNLTTNRLRGIFYLRCMDMCGSQIFGYMNIVSPPNTKKALKYINKFPTFDGLEYYQYTDLSFEDFDMKIYNDKGIESYKDNFIDKLYSLLLNHLICLNKEGKSQNEINELISGSILKDKTYYKHTSKKKLLKKIFKN